MVLSSFDLSGKTALVTGCNKGIGKSMAVGLAEAGADIIGVSGSLPANGSAIQTEVEKLGRRFTAYQANLSDRQSLYTFIQQVQDNHPVVDILVNNAGTILRKPAAEHPDEYWDTVLSLNLDAPFILAREFGKKMLERGGGKIIFTCSLLSFQGGINVPGYAASKGALSSLVKALANEWAGKGVQVNGIAPGYIAT
ncbi:MAG TPA: SDR family NAD(P)-dependent oxidoreductase, partial [Sediminibacterium sp.]|nr:SDR family NAD(P)-dependent oxidoreductase [Sediminibacterium sp.]